MRVGLIDVDGHNFPNLALMKLSAWHKARGDSVEWYEPMLSGHMDKVYMSKVFSFTPDYEWNVDADVVEKGGSGYCISVVDGKEVYDKSKDRQLPYEIEHIYPDYSIYPELTEDTAYGFMTRGCPRGCGFCHVKDKEGRRSYKVADLSEFWRGQKHIVLMDANTLACPEWRDILKQLSDSKAYVNFNQGLDIRMMTEEKAEALKSVKTERIHFAWDRYEDRDKILPLFETYRKTIADGRAVSVYILCGYDTTLEQDLERIYSVRDVGGHKKGFSPYVMLYNKDSLPKGHTLRRLQRWCNNRFIFWKTERFEDYES